MTSLLLQKGAHDLDVIHWLAGGYTRRVTGLGDLAVYGDITSRRDNSDRTLWDWYSADNWPPTAQTDPNPVIDVEDISMLQMRLDNGVLASYQQCHFTPDYWRNYTVIGDAGRLENVGVDGGDVIHVWTSPPRRALTGARTRGWSPSSCCSPARVGRPTPRRSPRARPSRPAAPGRTPCAPGRRRSTWRPWTRTWSPTSRWGQPRLVRPLGQECDRLGRGAPGVRRGGVPDCPHDV